MSRGICECPDHGEYHEVGPYYDCPDCRIEDALDIMETVGKLHEGKITAHWLWVAVERVAAGEPVHEVMADYGYTYQPPEAA